MPVDVPLLYDRVLTGWGQGRRVSRARSRLGGESTGPVDIRSISSQVDFPHGITNNNTGGIVVLNGFIGCNDLLARQVKPVVIPVDLVEGLVEGTVHDCLLLGGDIFEVVHIVALDLEDQIRAGAHHVVIVDGYGVLRGGRLGSLGTEVGSHAADWGADQKGGEKEKRG